MAATSLASVVATVSSSAVVPRSQAPAYRSPRELRSHGAGARLGLVDQALRRLLLVQFQVALEGAEQVRGGPVGAEGLGRPGRGPLGGEPSAAAA